MSEQPLMNSSRESVLSLSEETQFSPNGIVSRTLFHEGQQRVVLFGFDAGQELTEHSTPRRALVQVLGGECEFTLGGTPHQLGAGAMLHMPPGLPHSVKATTRFSMLLTLLPA